MFVGKSLDVFRRSLQLIQRGDNSIVMRWGCLMRLNCWLCASAGREQCACFWHSISVFSLLTSFTFKSVHFFSRSGSVFEPNVSHPLQGPHLLRAHFVLQASFNPGLIFCHPQLIFFPPPNIKLSVCLGSFELCSLAVVVVHNLCLLYVFSYDKCSHSKQTSVLFLLQRNHMKTEIEIESFYYNKWMKWVAITLSFL